MKVISNPNALPTEKKPAKRKNKAILYERLARHMSGEFVGYSVPFPVRFVIIEVTPGVLEPAVVKCERTKVVEFCTKSEVRRQILRWAWVHGPTTEFHWDTENATKCLNMWLDLTEPIPMPKSACFKNENEYCFVKHNFEPNYIPTPIFNEICSRMTNSIAFKCFIGSLFFEDSYKQQYLWLRGEGQDSKGCITRFIKRIMGPGCRSANPPSKGQNLGFWLDNIMKANCVVFSDIEDRKFVATGPGKSLTGGDIQSCERKFGAGYDAAFNGKLIFTSNWAPEISSEHSDQRRIIYCELRAKKEKTYESDYEQKLWLEAPGIIEECILQYESHCRPNEPIPTNTKQSLEIADDNEDEFHLFMERYEVKGIDHNKKYDDNPFCMQSDFTSDLRDFFKTDVHQKAAFKKWLIRTYAGDVMFHPIKVTNGNCTKTKRVVLGMVRRNGILCN
jgi:hypothetical protein